MYTTIHPRSELASRCHAEHMHEGRKDSQQTIRYRINYPSYTKINDCGRSSNTSREEKQQHQDGKPDVPSREMETKI